MTKPRRKSEIRKQAERTAHEIRASVAACQASAPAPRKQWRDVYLAALTAGATLERAASAAGVTRMAVHHARKKDAAFAQVHEVAYQAGLRQRCAILRSTTKQNRTTKKRADDTVHFVKSNFTLRAGPNAPAGGYPLNRKAQNLGPSAAIDLPLAPNIPKASAL